MEALKEGERETKRETASKRFALVIKFIGSRPRVINKAHGHTASLGIENM